MRTSLVAGNWKMNGSREQVTTLLQDLLPLLRDLTAKVECVVCPPSLYIAQTAEIIKSSNIRLGAQNVANLLNPAFTGEISPLMLREFACKYVIIGHSERRVLLQESDQLIAAKFKMALEAGLVPILCIGESQAQMEAGIGSEIVLGQLQAVIEVAGIAAFKTAVIAYEPVWAIGTGLSATPAQAQNMHAEIREFLASLNPEISTETRIIYGGSVNAGNAAALFAAADIDGGLIGGAALKAAEFSEICHAALRMAE